MFTHTPDEITEILHLGPACRRVRTSIFPVLHCGCRGDRDGLGDPSGGRKLSSGHAITVGPPVARRPPLIMWSFR